MAAGDLTSLASVKVWLGIPTGSTGDDALLTGLVTSASQFIQTWLDRQLAQANYTETRDGNGGQRLLFANYPVTAVSSLVIGGTAIAASSGYLTAGYLFTPGEIRLNGYRFCRGFGNIVVSYTAGYAVIPPDIAQAATELVALRYRERDRIGHASKTINGESVAFTIVDMPPSVRTALGQYRRVMTL